MILFAFDTETTGLDVNNDEVIEVGGVLYTTGQKRVLESVGMLVKTAKPISEEITRVTGITKAATERFGYDSSDALEHIFEMMQWADFVVAHNGKRFDKPMLLNWANRLGRKSRPEPPWIDTYTDLPGAEPGKLITMAAEHGFLPLDTHSALADAQTSLKLVTHPWYTIEGVIERAQTPDILIRSHQARTENDAAKKLKFRWNPEEKIWWKAVKETDLDSFVKTCPFDVSILDKSMSLEQLDG